MAWNLFLAVTPHELISLSIPKSQPKAHRFWLRWNTTLLPQGEGRKFQLVTSLNTRARTQSKLTGRRGFQIPVSVSHEFEHSCPKPVQTEKEGIQIPANARPFDRSRKNSPICQAPRRRERTAQEQLHRTRHHAIGGSSSWTHKSSDHFYRTRHHASEAAQCCWTSRPAINRKSSSLVIVVAAWSVSLVPVHTGTLTITQHKHDAFSEQVT